MKTPTCADCVYCIDGMIPAGMHPLLGTVYQRCPYCLDAAAIPTCFECDDTAAFPADYKCLHCLVVDLAQRGLLAAICPGCLGVTYILDPAEGGEAL
jgi:hypothetical protein